VSAKGETGGDGCKYDNRYDQHVLSIGRHGLLILSASPILLRTH
jgi:hypothetical protein